MNLQFLITLFVSSIMCDGKKNEDKNKKRFGKVYKNGDKSIFDVKITDEKQKINLNLKSKDFIPLYGTWYVGDKKINNENNIFFIGNVDIDSWLRFKLENEQNFNDSLGTFGDISYVHNINKNNFGKNYSDLEFIVAVIKTEDFKRIVTEFFNNIKKESLNSNKISEMRGNLFRNLRISETEYGIKFPDDSNKAPNFKDYEVLIYKNINISDNFKFSNLLKKSGIDVLSHVFISVGIFGFLIFIGRHSLSKYF